METEHPSLAVAILAILAKSGLGENSMQTLTAKDAKYAFGRLIDLARAAPVAVAKHGRAVVVVMSIEEYERLRALEGALHSPKKLRTSPTARRAAVE